MHAAPGRAAAASQLNSEVGPQEDWYHSERAKQIGKAGVIYIGDSGQQEDICGSGQACRSGSTPSRNHRPQ
eukprot:8978845-Karenia_brevis.AAC.1